MAATIDKLFNNQIITFDTLNLAVRSAMFNLGVTMADKIRLPTNCLKAILCN